MSDHDPITCPHCIAGREYLERMKQNRQSSLAQTLASEPSVDWVIIYDDPDHPLEMFTDETSARETFAARLVALSCNLFHRVPNTKLRPGEENQ